MKTLFLLLFAAVSAVHLAASFVSNKKLRAATKGFILLFLLLYYLFAAEKRNGVLIAAVATSWLGDVLLIPPGNGWFAAGGISFMLSHFCFIAVYIMAVNFADVNVLLTVLAFLVYCVLIFLVFRAASLCARSHRPAVLCLCAPLPRGAGTGASARHAGTRSHHCGTGYCAHGCIPRYGLHECL